MWQSLHSETSTAVLQYSTTVQSQASATLDTLFSLPVLSLRHICRHHTVETCRTPLSSVCGAPYNVYCDCDSSPDGAECLLTQTPTPTPNGKSTPHQSALLAQLSGQVAVQFLSMENTICCTHVTLGESMYTIRQLHALAYILHGSTDRREHNQ